MKYGIIIWYLSILKKISKIIQFNGPSKIFGLGIVTSASDNEPSKIEPIELDTVSQDKNWK